MAYSPDRNVRDALVIELTRFENSCWEGDQLRVRLRSPASTRAIDSGRDEVV